MRWPTHDRLVKVAGIYTNALADGLNPTATVAATLAISHSHAANLVHQARRHGKLQATTRGVAAAVVDRPT